MRSQTLEDTGESSRVEMQINDLVINRISGQIASHGAGWMTTIRPGDAGLKLPRSLAATPEPRSPPAAAKQDELTYLNVRFQRGITGNLHR